MRLIGCSELQGYSISLLLKHVYRQIPDAYVVATNEVGIHVDTRSNPALAIAIFRATALAIIRQSTQCTQKAPKAVTEVDVRTESEPDYMLTKTDEPLTFGIEKVIWVLYPTQANYRVSCARQPALQTLGRTC